MFPEALEPRGTEKKSPAGLTCSQSRQDGTQNLELHCVGGHRHLLTEGLLHHCCFWWPEWSRLGKIQSLHPTPHQFHSPAHRPHHLLLLTPARCSAPSGLSLWLLLLATFSLTTAFEHTLHLSIRKLKFKKWIYNTKTPQKILRILFSTSVWHDFDGFVCNILSLEIWKKVHNKKTYEFLMHSHPNRLYICTTENFFESLFTLSEEVHLNFVLLISVPCLRLG